jgi:hypothetical protein
MKEGTEKFNQLVEKYKKLFEFGRDKRQCEIYFERCFKRG